MIHYRGRPRSRGVEVLLLDDGGFAEVPGAVRDRVVQFAIRALDAAQGGSVTVRVLPAGRRNIATVLVRGTDGDRRTDIGRSGDVLVSE
ncbi:hypothetical protein [Nocardia sp. NBC_01329]|uniref:hypothetical protein n=1 Tax=Nocardia sp. NBC_01329 TaxID=2903594 RepID=UPI002E132929|nr:hypothetical protein OG405_05205 [Nocardia sp. NBC_01329]